MLTLTHLLLGGPGHDGYAYNGDVYCVDCGKDIIRQQYEDGEYEDGDSGDSDDHPQPIFFGESPDSAQHCVVCGDYIYGEEAENDDA
jgi:hypothetical protein